MKKAAILTILALTSVSSFTLANEPAEGWYLGGGIGSTGFDLDLDIKNSGTTVEPDGTALKVYGGFQFNRILSAEMSYISYGDLNVKQEYQAFYDAVHTLASPTSISLSANLGYTFDNGWRPFVMLGLSSVYFNTKQKSDISDKHTGFHAGLGVEYSPKFIDDLTMRLAYEADMFEAKSQIAGNVDFTLDAVYFGASYKF